MKRLLLIAALAALSTGCAIGTQDASEVERDAASIGGFDDDVHFVNDPGSVDVSLDAVFGDEVSLSGGSEAGYEGDDGGPDPTPWKLSSGEEQAGPDPTPWRDVEDDDEDDDDIAGATADMGPDPTPWSPDMHSEDDDDREPDPQPWRTATVGDGNGED